jgi:DNA-directed RNA polymerase specialized sigma subunit
MEKGLIQINDADIQDFFKDIKQMGTNPFKKITERDRQIIIMAYEKGYNKEQVSQKLGVGTRTMRKIYEEHIGEKI